MDRAVPSSVHVEDEAAADNRIAPSVDDEADRNGDDRGRYLVGVDSDDFEDNKDVDQDLSWEQTPSRYRRLQALRTPRRGDNIREPRLSRTLPGADRADLSVVVGVGVAGVGVGRAAADGGFALVASSGVGCLMVELRVRQAVRLMKDLSRLPLCYPRRD